MNYSSFLSARVRWLLAFSHYSFVSLFRRHLLWSNRNAWTCQEKSLLIVVEAQSFPPSDNKTLSTLRMSSASLVSYWVALVCMWLETFDFIEAEIKKCPRSATKDFSWITTATFRQSARGFLVVHPTNRLSKAANDFTTLSFNVEISVIRSQFEACKNVFDSKVEK